MHHLPTIKDIARNLKISIATVSRALRGTYDVSNETRERVQAMAAQLNYKPNYNAIGLAKGSTHNIGIILPFITNYYFATVITGIQEIAYKNGYNIILFVTNDSCKTELSIIENLAVTGLDGLLVCISSDSDECRHFGNIITEGTPIVFFDRVAKSIKTSKVMQDDFNGAFEAVEHLIQSGYNKISHITGPKELMITELRLSGYLSALKKYKLPVRDEWIVHSGFSQEHGELDTYQLLDKKYKPDAIFAVNDRKALGSMIALKNRNVAIGREIGIIGFTNDPLSTIISPSLSTVSEPAFEIGKQSCELLIKHIQKKHFIPEERILKGKLIVRESSKRL